MNQPSHRIRGARRLAPPILFAATLACVIGIAGAQTPAQLEYERQQREYWRQQEQQRQEQQRQQQIMQENARRQQEESSRINAPATSGQGSNAPVTGSGASRGADPTGAQAYSAARAMWEKRPALPADRNPLLGKWMRPASTRPNPSDPFGQIAALAKGGLCAALFGDGVFEFRVDRLMGKFERSAEQELDRVEYRGDAKHVVVLPKASVKLIEFDFEGADRVNWKSQNCVLVRVGAASASASAAPSTAAQAAQASSTRPAITTGGALSMSMVAPSAASKVAGLKLWVLKEDAQVALIRGGLKSTPDGSALQNWMRACVNKSADCEKGVRALQAHSVGMATTDANGHAQTPALPAGRYWILSEAKFSDKRVVWNEPVVVKGGDMTITLDQRNARPVD